MSKHRLLFAKEGKAKYISHLDLMRTLQRAFLRAGIKIYHTEGFNPHPYLSIALPLSVGCESVCELLDFEMLDDRELCTLPAALNQVLPEGIKVLEAYEAQRKFKEITWLQIDGFLIYDKGLPERAMMELTSFFQSESIILSKKSKKGMTEFDIVPCMHSIEFQKVDGLQIKLTALIAAQNPSLNPEYLIRAISDKISDFNPDFTIFKRHQVLDQAFNIFR